MTYASEHHSNPIRIRHFNRIFVTDRSARLNDCCNPCFCCFFQCIWHWEESIRCKCATLCFSPACVIAILQNLHGSSVQHRHQLSYHLLLKQLHLISHALQLSKLVLNLSILALKVHVSLELKLYFHLMITYLPLEREGHLVQKLIFACACRFFNIYS